jgi:hypothetical protein
VAQNSLAMFINQYAQGALAAQQGIINQLANVVPDWLSQYIGSGGGMFGNGGL